MWKLAGDEARKVVSRALRISEAVGAANADEIDKKGPDAETPGQVVVREVVPTSSEEQAAPVNLGNAKGRPVHHKAPPQRRTGQPLALDEMVGRTDCPVNVQRRDANTLSPGLTPDGAPAHETAPAHRQARRVLRVIEGGGRRQEGETSAAFRTRAGGGDRGCKLLKLVVG